MKLVLTKWEISELPWKQRLNRCFDQGIFRNLK